MALARRGFLKGLISSLATPAIIRTPGLLMAVRPILLSPRHLSDEAVAACSVLHINPLGVRQDGSRLIVAPSEYQKAVNHVKGLILHAPIDISFVGFLSAVATFEICEAR